MSSTAVCLLSGGLDSATALYVAMRECEKVYALTIHYGQLHEREIQSAHKITKKLSIPHEVIEISMPWKGSALLDSKISLPKNRESNEMALGIPATYVPARNTVFLSLAASYAETVKANLIYIGANAIDYSGYPDCRPEYFEQFEKALTLGTKCGAEGRGIKIKTPLILLKKSEIIQLGNSLNVPYDLTWSCYQGGDFPCGECDSCVLRAKGFEEAGAADPLLPLTHPSPLKGRGEGRGV